MTELQRLIESVDVALSSPNPTPSPCTSVCRMSQETGLCEGCLRTLDEIVAWSQLSDEGAQGKRAIWSAIGQRARLAVA